MAQGSGFGVLWGILGPSNVVYCVAAWGSPQEGSFLGGGGVYIKETSGT